MGSYLRGAYANNQQAKSMARVSKAKAGELPATAMARHIRFKLLVNRSAIAALTANAHAGAMMQHQIDQFSNADVTFIGIRFDTGGNEIELVTDHDLDDFVVERLQPLARS